LIGERSFWSVYKVRYITETADEVAQVITTTVDQYNAW
jgi:hypothetical protein